MRKFIIITMLALLAFSFPAMAANNDFVADGSITVSGVTFGANTADMIIFSGSSCESWKFNSGTFTVTNSGGFKIGSSNASVKSITAVLGNSTVACAANSNPGTSYLSITSENTYQIVPSSSESCSGASPLPPSGSAPSGSSSSSTTSSSSDEETQATATEAEVITTEEPAATADSSEPATDNAGNVTLEQMTTDAQSVVSGDVSQLIATMGTARDLAAEAEYNQTIVAKIVTGSEITAEVRNVVNNFVTYGTPATKMLGAGERAGVVNSFKSAFAKIPTTAEDWNDVIKIANGRWPTQRSQKAEDRANINFRAVYLRDPDRTNPHDDAAITVMAYGLRPANRNLDSEKAAIKSFRAIYGYYPEKATAWDVVRAIAYSGAVR